MLLQVKAHWDGGIPAALRDHAVVPITGILPDGSQGTASAQHCADRVLVRSCDLRQFPVAAPPAELMARLAALGCLVTDDPRCDRLRVLEAAPGCEPPAAPPSKARALAALHALPEEELLADLTALANAADAVAADTTENPGAGKAITHFKMVRALVANAVPALPVDLQLRDGFLARLPVFRYAVGGHGPAVAAWLAPDAQWELLLRPCAELLPEPLLASAQVRARQRLLPVMRMLICDLRRLYALVYAEYEVGHRLFDHETVIVTRDVSEHSLDPDLSQCFLVWTPTLT